MNSTQPTLIDGKRIAAEHLSQLKRQLSQWQSQGRRMPGLTVVRVGDDPASGVYVNKKAKTAQELGITSHIEHLSDNISKSQMMDTLERLNADDNVDAVLVQLPLPDHLDALEIMQHLDPAKDADGFHPVNLGLLMAGAHPVAPPCTPAGIIALLKAYDVPLAGSHAVVIGRSMIVGKPLALMLLNESATVSVCHSKTQNLSAMTRQADILIAAVGKPHFINANMIKADAVVMDVGINRRETAALSAEVSGASSTSKLVGDIDFDNVAPKARLITPVPGGVGPMTIAMLMRNTVALYAQRQGIAAL
ncbi:MAG: bifunctional methylenetetrahydrofolate dehydrogenase/methenyltetrahydrofolate cyclohydrolase FolD [Vampirovibrionales bacterium]|nr:bifunctional methylenetetrahydrofolate dehydrogenase/methenyltetrahydrofolate cyclohydrolase FolD [Vampirovibrionales bacterium]